MRRIDRSSEINRLFQFPSLLFDTRPRDRPGTCRDLVPRVAQMGTANACRMVRWPNCTNYVGQRSYILPVAN